MTAMLASVRSLPEARRAYAAGADVVDCKDPDRGALGALPLRTVGAIARALNDKVCTSAAAGELAPNPTDLVAEVQPLADCGIDFVKVGLPQGVDASVWAKALGQLAARGVRLVAVLFADRRPAGDVLAELAAAGVTGVLLDTADKALGGLRVQMSHRELANFVERAKGLGLLTGLAGSLQAAEVPALLSLEPHYLGFRGALCGSAGRQAELDSGAVCRVRRMIPRAATHLETGLRRA